MKTEDSPTAFNAQFIMRTKDARIRAALTQENIADILQIKQDTYKQYETRTPLPHRYVPAFCAATHVSERWLFTGRDRHRQPVAAE